VVAVSMKARAHSQLPNTAGSRSPPPPWCDLRSGRPDNLQVALEARAIIEQAKGVLHAELAISPDEAFELLRRSSQNTNQKVRTIAARLVRGEIAPRRVRAQAS
jgi:hypothetical protein